MLYIQKYVYSILWIISGIFKGNLDYVIFNWHAELRIYRERRFDSPMRQSSLCSEGGKKRGIFILCKKIPWREQIH